MFDERELLDKQVEVTEDSALKTYIINRVGEKLKPEGGLINVEMVISVLAEEFPDIVLALAEENFIRGYTQGIADAGGNTHQSPQETPENGE